MAFFEFPHTRTYDSDLAWLIKAYKILTGKVNNIEQTIEDTINEALQGEELRQLITQMLAEALPLNVKYPPAESGLTPAAGDGETDDTAALQAMIAYANAHNMPMIFPAGVYRVTGLDVNIDTVFRGFDATLMLAPVSAKPLITLTADLATSGLTLNGNLGGQTTAQDIINIVNGSFAITNTSIMGGKSCIKGSLVGDSMIGDSYLGNFQEYGIHVEGSGNFTASNVALPSVASSGAMRFMLIDCNNCTVSGFSSQATVPIGFEITGNNNVITANTPNVATPVNDSGTGNTWTIIGKDEKRYFNGSIALNAVNYNVAAENYNVAAEETAEISGENVILNPTNALTYNKTRTSRPTARYFSSVPFTDGTNEYNVAVISDITDKVKNVLAYGAVADGETDNTELFNSLIENGVRIVIPPTEQPFKGNILITADKVEICGGGTLDGTITLTGSNENDFWLHAYIHDIRIIHPDITQNDFVNNLNDIPDGIVVTRGFSIRITGCYFENCRYAVYAHVTEDKATPFYSHEIEDIFMVNNMLGVCYAMFYQSHDEDLTGYTYPYLYVGDFSIIANVIKVAVGYGVYFQDSDGGIIANNTIFEYGDDVAPIEKLKVASIMLPAALGFIIDGNQLFLSGVSGYFVNITGTENVVSNNRFINGYRGIFISGDDNTICNNLFYYQTDYVIVVSNANKLHTDNTILNTDNYGIYLEGNNSNIVNNDFVLVPALKYINGYFPCGETKFVTEQAAFGDLKIYVAASAISNLASNPRNGSESSVMFTTSGGTFVSGGNIETAGTITAEANKVYTFVAYNNKWYPKA